VEFVDLSQGKLFFFRMWILLDLSQGESLFLRRVEMRFLRASLLFCFQCVVIAIFAGLVMASLLCVKFAFSFFFLAGLRIGVVVILRARSQSTTQRWHLL